MNPSRALLRPTPCHDALIARYEELRGQALGRPSVIPRGQGLALLLRRGMAAWMRAWAQCAPQLPTPPKEQRGDESILPFEMHREVTMILAGMVLSGRQEASA